VTESEEYWTDFYKQKIAPESESNFAQFVLDYLVKERLTSKQLIDVACGNGRDTFFFESHGICSTGVDQSVQPKAERPKFIQDDIISFDYKFFNIIYLRFIVHALSEDQLDHLLKRIRESVNDATIFIETRSSKGITDQDKSETFFNSGIGKEHFRLLYSEEYLTNKLQANFEVLFIKESKGFSMFKDQDPVCIRYILRKKNKFI